MRALRPCTFHAGQSCALACFMRADHAPSHFSCGPFTRPRTFHAGQSCALARFMRANHAPSHFSCGPITRPGTLNAGQSRALALFMRAMRPRTSHAGLAPSHLSCAFAPYMRANHAPSHLLWANHEPSHFSCGPITNPRWLSHLSCRPINDHAPPRVFHESTS